MVLTLEIILTSSLGRIQQANAPETAVKNVCSCFYLRLVITRVRYNLYTELKPNKVKASHEFTNIASVGDLLSPDELHIAIALVTGAKIFECTKCRCGKIVDELGLHGLSCTKNAGRFPRHSAINSILKRSLTRTGLLSGRMAWLAGLTLGPWYRGRSLVWDTIVVDTFAQGHSIKTLPYRLVLRPQKLRSQNAKNIMTSKTITTFNQWQLWPLVCMANPLPLFCVVFLLWPGEMLPAYWPVCKFDLILPVLFLAAFNVLTPNTVYRLPLCQCVAIAFRILVISVRFIVPSVVQCYLVHWLNILSIAWPHGESTAWFRVQHCLKPLRLSVGIKKKLLGLKMLYGEINFH